MDETSAYLPGLSPVKNKELCARFDGGRLSSDGGVLLLRHEHLRLRTKNVSRESYCVGRGMDKQSPALQVNSAFVLCVAHFLSTNDQSSRQSNRVRKQRWIWSSQKHAPVAGTDGTDLAGPGKGAGLGFGHRPGTSVAFVAYD